MRVPDGASTCSSCAHRATVPMERGARLWWHEAMEAARPTARPSRWTPRTRCSSSTPPARPASPRACCTRRRLPALRRHDHKYVFDYREGDVYWCTADVGWITGHSYIVYGPLANGATTVMFEACIPTYPDAGRFWEVVDKHKVTSSTPRPPRSARSCVPATRPGHKHDRRVLRGARHVGEPINPEAVDVVPRRRRRGALPDRRHLVADRDRRHHDHPAARRDTDQAGLGDAAVLRRRARCCRRPGQEIEGNGVDGLLVITPLARQDAHVYGDHSASRRPTSRLPGLLLHRRRLPPRRGRLLLDHRPRRRRAQRLRPPHGHRRGRIRARLAPKVAEAAVVGYPHEIKGQGIYAYVTSPRPARNTPTS
jgi:acetyl-CoA synthetase